MTSDGLRPTTPSTKRITDVRTMRALTHPLRLRLLGLLRQDSPATATTLAAEVDESVASVSYHLRQLATHGFIEDAPEQSTDGRERWWRAAHQYTSWSAVDFLDSPEKRSARLALERQVLHRYVELLQTYLDQEPAWGEEWLRAATSGDEHRFALTAEDLAGLKGEVSEVIARYRERGPSGPDAARVEVILAMFPVERL